MRDKMTFYEPVVVSDDGIVIRGDKRSKYYMVLHTTGAIVSLTPSQESQVDEYLKSKQHFKNDLFKL